MITSTPVTADNYYWLAYNSNSAIGDYQATPGTIKAKWAPYSNFSFPSSAGTGFYTLTTAIILLAGSGDATE
jgi:hypothetical protein